MRLFLGIETSGEETALALVRDEDVIGSLHEPSQARHNEVIFDMLSRLFNSAAVRPQDLTGIGVSIGPGMFTSLRVGLSVAKGSALSLGLPLKGVSTLDALVRTANREPRTAHREPPTHTADWLVPLIDARKGEVYAALYRGGEHMADFLIINPRQVASAVIELTSSSPQPSPLRGEGETGKNSNRRFLLLGTGARRYRNELAETFGTSAEFLELDYPSPEVIAFEARDRIEHGEADSLNDLSPLYLRRTDAELRRDGHPSSPQPSPQRGEGEKSTLPNAH